MKRNIPFNVYSKFKDMLVAAKTRTNFVKYPFVIPIFQEEEIISLFDETLNFLKQTPPLIRTNPPCQIIGDISGNIYDLVRLLSHIDSISTTNIIFLGNYMSSNLYSLETLILLCSMYCLFPKSIFLLRSDSECQDVAFNLRLFDEILEIYGNDTLFKQIIEIFAWMPIVSIISDQYICMHGCINSTISNLQELQNINRPIYDITLEPVCSCCTTPDQYDSKFIKKFLNNSGMRMMIVGGGTNPKGIGVEAGGKIIALTSNGSPQIKHTVGFVTICLDLEARGHSLTDCACMMRNCATFNKRPSYSDMGKKRNPIIFRQIISQRPVIQIKRKAKSYQNNMPTLLNCPE